MTSYLHLMSEWWILRHDWKYWKIWVKIHQKSNLEAEIKKTACPKLTECVFLTQNWYAIRNIWKNSKSSICAYQCSRNGWYPLNFFELHKLVVYVLGNNWSIFNPNDFIKHSKCAYCLRLWMAMDKNAKTFRFFVNMVCQSRKFVTKRPIFWSFSTLHAS